MICSLDSIKLYKDSCSYSGILEPYNSPASRSFEIPFNDPNMEPLPLDPNTSNCNGNEMILSSAESLFLKTDDDPSSTFDERSKPLSLDTNLRQDRISILDPFMGIAGSKRSSDDLFVSNQGLVCKRQRTSLLQAAAPDEERMRRFRPYQEKQWREQFTKLCQFKLENGHCRIPYAYPEDPALARWVKRQRYQYKKLKNCDPTSTMTISRLQDLESIGFVWHSHALTWQAKLNELTAFKRSTGHCNVPSQYPENAPLSTWVKGQRRQYKLYKSGSSSSTMTVERFRALESLGFVFVTAPSNNCTGKQGDE